MKKLTVTLIGLAFAGCGTSSQPSGPETLPELVIPPKPENGLQIITPIFENIQPGMDYEVCTWTDAVLDQVTDIRSTLGSQPEPPGHHTIVFYTLQKQPPGTQRVCTDNDMASFRFLAGNGGNLELNEAPADLVYRIPAGAQIVINHHYLNATDTVMRGQALVNLNFAGAGNYIPSGNTAFVQTDLNVPPGKSALDFSCTVDRMMKLWYFAPHMHRWGKNIKIDITQSGSTARLFDVTWDPAFTFHPPEKRMDPKAPMVLNKGDKVAVHCEWDNDTGRTLNFGFEMCVGFGQYVDDGNLGNWACDNGFWTDF